MSEKTDQLIQLLAEQQKLQADQLEEFRRQQADTNSKIVELLNGKSVPISSSLPTFPGFDPTCELLSDYMSRFKTYADAHSLHESKQAGIFLTNQSPSLYKQLSNLAAQLSTPKQINELTLDEIEKFLREQYDPAQFIVRERHKFWSDMSRKPGEAINELAARIRQDASTCDFTEITDPLDEAMRTRFMCSVNNEAVLKALFKIKPAELWSRKRHRRWLKRPFTGPPHLSTKSKVLIPHTTLKHPNPSRAIKTVTDKVMVRRIRANREPHVSDVIIQTMAPTTASSRMSTATIATSKDILSEHARRKRRSNLHAK